MQNRSRHFRTKAMVLPLLRECDGGDLGARERERENAANPSFPFAPGFGFG
jgi:hypothetical protein